MPSPCISKERHGRVLGRVGGVKKQKKRQVERRHKGRVERRERCHLFQGAPTEAGTKDLNVYGLSSGVILSRLEKKPPNLSHQKGFLLVRLYKLNLE